MLSTDDTILQHLEALAPDKALMGMAEELKKV